MSLLTEIVIICCDGRVVKALDLKSNGVSPRRFESCSQRKYFAISLQPFLVRTTVFRAFGPPTEWQSREQLPFDGEIFSLRKD